MNKMKSPSGEDLAENLDREMQKFKLKVRIGYLRAGGIVINVTGNRVTFVVGSATADETLLDLAVHQSCSDEGESFVLFWRYVRLLLRLDVWDGP